MNKKTVWPLYAAAVLVAAGILLVPMLSGSRPFKNLRAEDVAFVELAARPPDATIRIAEQEQIREITAALNQVVLYQRSDEYRDYAGQYVQFALIMNSGERVEAAAFNPFFIINGQGYKTRYEPCEELNRLANAYLSEAGKGGAAGGLKKLLGFSLDEIHERYGEPDGMLFGFWGEIYRLEDGTQFTVYYDGDGRVNAVKSGDMLFQAE
ncbi:MAG TPA: hypothetical protein VN366_07620 [Feifaniaceae bacterium]|nr:hypothetical protein [Feifaniaceae bacterium]